MGDPAAAAAAAAYMLLWMLTLMLLLLLMMMLQGRELIRREQEAVARGFKVGEVLHAAEEDTSAAAGQWLPAWRPLCTKLSRVMSLPCFRRCPAASAAAAAAGMLHCFCPPELQQLAAAGCHCSVSGCCLYTGGVSPVLSPSAITNGRGAKLLLEMWPGLGRWTGLANNAAHDFSSLTAQSHATC
jgi:hypothetical protein